jgi:fructokinase
MARELLFPLLRGQVLDLLNNYVRAESILRNIDDYIVPPWLGDRAGVLGALALAERVVAIEAA